MQSFDGDEPGLELADRREQRVGKSGRRGRRRQLSELELRQRAACGEGALHVGRLRQTIVSGNVPEEVVERSDGSGEESGPPCHEVAFDTVDVPAIGDDEPRVAIEALQVALEEQGDLARMRRSNHERKPHASIVVPASGALSYGLRAFVQRALKPSPGPLRTRPRASSG